MLKLKTNFFEPIQLYFVLIDLLVELRAELFVRASRKRIENRLQCLLLPLRDLIRVDAKAKSNSNCLVSRDGRRVQLLH